MASWCDYARADPALETCAISVVSADSPVKSPTSVSIGAIGAIGTGVLSVSLFISSGLAVLASMACPGRVNVPRWASVVADAQRLARDGWAAKALALGWSEMALFGVVNASAGDGLSGGLAVWQGGRKILAISATTATVEDGEGRAYYTRREQVGAKLLWEIQ